MNPEDLIALGRIEQSVADLKEQRTEDQRIRSEDRAEDRALLEEVRDLQLQTNGRVRALERFQAKIEGALSPFIGWAPLVVAGVLVAVVTHYFWH